MEAAIAIIKSRVLCQHVVLCCVRVVHPCPCHIATSYRQEHYMAAMRKLFLNPGAGQSRAEYLGT
jgi:hypothetical protein